MTPPSTERIEGRRLADQAIVVGDVGAASIYRCELSDCHVVVDTKEPTGCIYDSVLRNCTIDFKRKLRHARLFSNDFQRCSFSGRFQGVDFGRAPKADPLTGDLDKRGSLIECDFTRAVMDLCRLYDVDVNQQRFAPLPQFVIPYEREKFRALASEAWPGKLGIFFAVLKDEPTTLSGCTGTLPDFAKKYQLTERELLESLEITGALLRT